MTTKQPGAGTLCVHAGDSYDASHRAIVQLVGDLFFFRPFVFRRFAQLDAVLG
jgi:hypothetical protein